ncbi:MAG: phytanoyl-CoA dioxygenase family protein [Gemmatimonadota bacterium]|nr:phytanoyl-CoA dioxygenase family protein [Gemmatimonadota bacterium]
MSAGIRSRRHPRRLAPWSGAGALPTLAMLLQTMWMLPDFTEDNGATRMVPGSHLSGRMPRKGDESEEIIITSSKGSVLIWHGATWHRTGPNTSSDRHRMGANVAYIPSFIHRPLDGWPLVKRSAYEKLSGDLQGLLERSVEDQEA